ncbi:CinA family protein [Nocardia sp. NPDC058379]|uniref:CinA family protein n=1 Tax=unclassified Nocardia TaxID=2637762 RepID=UPI003656F1C1
MNAIADQLADLAERHGLTVAVAESLTAGNLAAALGAAPDSAVWFRGGVIAYATEVKRHVLDVPDVPVVSETAAMAMAEGVRALMDADIAVATTGVGGPGPQDGEPAGSVWFCVVSRRDVRTSHRRFDGDPSEVLVRSVRYALELLLSMAEREGRAAVYESRGGTSSEQEVSTEESG